MARPMTVVSKRGPIPVQVQMHDMYRLIVAASPEVFGIVRSGNVELQVQTAGE